MKKAAERTNVLTEGNNKNFIHAILNAVNKGYSDNTIVDDIIELIRTKDVSSGVLTSTPDALRGYADSFQKSLQYIADEIENFEIEEPKEFSIKRKIVEDAEEPNEDEDSDDENVIEEELEKLEEENDEDDDDDDEPEEKQVEQQYTSSKIASVNDLDWDNGYDEKENKLAGILSVDFNQDMSMYKRGNKVSLSGSTLKEITLDIFNYFRKEYPRLKANLNRNIFKSNLKFIDIEKGKAAISYEIENAY